MPSGEVEDINITKKRRFDPKEAESKTNNIDLKCINTIRLFSAEMPEAAKSGHPGAPMGCAPITHLLYSSIMKYSPSKPTWINRDRFVLSNGHACALLYSMLHLTGYDVTLEDCKKFRKAGSKTPGHPENFMTDGVEVSTGPLGQGISNAVGLAIGERHLSAAYNTSEYPIFSNYTYVLCGDGCLQEGVSSEACSLAGHLGLGKLIVFYDDNNITIDGSTDLSFTEDVGKRFESYGWHVQTVDDITGSLDALKKAVAVAQEMKDKPSIIKVKTMIGYGSKKEGSHTVHGAPLGGEDMAQVKSKFGFDPNKHFIIDEDVQSFYKSAVEKSEKKCKDWEGLYQEYKEKFPAKAEEIERRFRHEIPTVLDDLLPTEVKDLATRQHSNLCLNAIAPDLPELIGGSADLTPSNLTALKCSGDFQKDTPSGRYIRFGVREHAMAAISNGLFAYGAFRPFCATFLNFAGYALGAIRVSALSKFGVIYIMTHDSIGLGEDGPTHQPIEMLETLRSTPNMLVFRPADGKETAASYKMALQNVHTPSVIALSRSKLVSLETSSIEDASKGAYIARKETSDAPAIILIGTGSEVSLCIDAAKELGPSVRVVSMPCQELFLSQSTEYQRSILPGTIPTLSVEASSICGWHRFSHAQVGIDNRFGISGNYKEVFKLFGFSIENVVSKGKKLLEFYKGRSAPDLYDRPSFDNFQGLAGH